MRHPRSSFERREIGGLRFSINAAIAFSILFVSNSDNAIVFKTQNARSQRRRALLRRPLYAAVKLAALQAITSLQLPEAVVDTAMDVDGKHAAARNLHRREGYFAASLHRRGDGGFDVVHQPVGPYHGLL